MEKPMDAFKGRIIQEWGGGNFFCFFSESIWSSSLQQKDLVRVRGFLINSGISNVDISLVIPPDSSTSRQRWSKYYDLSGQCVSSLVEEPIPGGSNNIKFTFCYSSIEDRQDRQTQELHTVNILRLIFGVPIARELLLTRSFSSDTCQPISHSEKGFASYFDTQNLNFFNDPDIEKARIRQLPPESTILLDKAFSQIFPIERFVLMWSAFEAVISSLPIPGNNGDKRKKYFNNELGSQIINNEVFRLHRIRCDIFKEGKFSGDQIEKDCWSLYAALQLAILEDSEQRQAFTRGYEKALSSDD